MRNSRMCEWRDVSIPEECGILSIGPASCRRLTVKSTLFCSAAVRVSHQRPNSSEYSTSQGTLYYVIEGIMPSTALSKEDNAVGFPMLAKYFPSHHCPSLSKNNYRIQLHRIKGQLSPARHLSGRQTHPHIGNNSTGRPKQATLDL